MRPATRWIRQLSLIGFAQQRIQTNEEEQHAAGARENREQYERPLDIHYLASFHSAYFGDRM